MGKQRDAAPVLMEDFEPFFLRGGLLYVPYWSAGKTYLHKVPPPIAMKGVGYIGQLLGDNDNIVSITAAALRKANPNENQR